MIYDWPTKLLAPRISNLRLINRTRSAGASLTGFEQVSDPITQRWAFTIDFPNLRKDAILPFRALVASLKGRSNVVRVPIFDQFLWAPDDAIGIANVPDRLDPWADYDDGEKISDVSATVTVAQGVNALTVDLSNIDEPSKVILAGQYFGIGDDLHVIGLNGVSFSGNVATVTFEPSTRRARTRAPFKLRPTLLCRLANDESGAHPMQYGRITAPTLDMVEVLADELASDEVAL